MSADGIAAVDVLRNLKQSDAFRGVRCLRVERDTMTSKVAQICATYLAKFLGDYENRQCAEDLATRKRVFTKARRDLGNDLLPRRRVERELLGLDGAIEMAHRAAGLQTRRQWLEMNEKGALVVKSSFRTRAAARLRRDRMHLDMLTVDLCVALRHMTEMSVTGILCMALPPIFETLSETYTHLLPKRGLGAPEARFKRFISSCLRRMRHDNPGLTRKGLLDMRECLLFEAP